MNITSTKAGLLAPAPMTSAQALELRGFVQKVVKSIALYTRASSAAHVAALRAERYRVMNDARKAELIRILTP